MNHDDLVARSLARVWHPCTQMQDHAGGPDANIPLIPIRSAEGVWLEGTDGRRYLDAVSSWWTNIFGHRHPHIVASLKDQLDTLDHVIFAGFTHAPAVEVAERLCKLAPEGLDKKQVPLLAPITLSLDWASQLGITVAVLAQRFARDR